MSAVEEMIQKIRNTDPRTAVIIEFREYATDPFDNKRDFFDICITGHINNDAVKVDTYVDDVDSEVDVCYSKYQNGTESMNLDDFIDYAVSLFYKEQADISYTYRGINYTRHRSQIGPAP